MESEYDEIDLFNEATECAHIAATEHAESRSGGWYMLDRDLYVVFSNAPHDLNEFSTNEQWQRLLNVIEKLDLVILATGEETARFIGREHRANARAAILDCGRDRITDINTSISAETSRIVFGS